ncbi:MAG: lytic transglycosylase domain-containing protein [Gammaproteobacteria bacterium]|nr:lytic transglycosylase domain-containing protein [Gammaproteobacteria bacterium]
MSWNSCTPDGRRPSPERRGRLALLFCALLAAATPAIGATADQQRDAALREKLRVAVTEPLGFADEFAAQVWLLDMAGRLAPRVPDPDERLAILKAVHQEATRVALPPEMILAVIDVESGFERFAVSRANAQGLMQVMRFWLQELDMPGHALLDIQENIRMGCTILRHYYDLEKGNWTRALARYNGSLGSRAYPDRVFERLRSRWFRQ